MQTFLPYRDFEETARCLDYRRLGKQRVECKQILSAIRGETNAWANHPAVKMWKDHVDTLKHYYNVILQEWINRGYKNNMPFETFENFCSDGYTLIMIGFPLPEWLTDDFCSRHRAALLYKDYDYYSKFGWKEKPEINYLWGD
jgi:hypothetical protein